MLPIFKIKHGTARSSLQSTPLRLKNRYNESKLEDATM